MEDVANWKIAILGLGISGRSAANFLARRGARVCVFDERSEDAIGSLDGLDASVERRLGSAFPSFGEFDLVVPSPGVPAARYRDSAVRVWGDIEIAYRAGRAPIIAVTGTNGKSTTVLLIEAMLQAAGARARAVGNVGEPALGLVGEALDFAVLEVSSFQLEATQDFRPDVGVLLNITPDHLDRHGTLQEYAAAKDRLFENQRESDVAVLNLDDPLVAERAPQMRARVIGFRSSGPGSEGTSCAYLDAESAVLCEPGNAPIRIPLDGFRLEGRHNRENALAALAAVHSAGVDPRAAAAALRTFNGLPHRCEFVAEVRGVRYVNDSKATNPGAALQSLVGFSQKLVWIAGGRDKDLEFDELIDVAALRARAAVLIGEASDKLSAALSGRLETQRADSIEQAVRMAARLAHSGDVVLLSPACASQDQFLHFAQRGERFAAAVHALADASDEASR
jgi:UDP-N-acetylmuramoylalanine--D-glutamate ligase